MDHETMEHREYSCDDEANLGEAIESLPTEQVDPPKRDSKRFMHQWRDLSLDRKIESGIGVVGLIVAIVLAWTAVGQLAAMKEQTDSMRGQLAEMKSSATETEKLVTATEKIAEATKNSVEQSAAALKANIEASRLEQRAWVGPISFMHPIKHEGGGQRLIKEGSHPSFLYQGSSSIEGGLLYSKMAMLELCGWIEMSMDDIVLNAAQQLIRDTKHLKYFKSVVQKVSGFEYQKHFRHMVITLIGLQGVETMEKNADPLLFLPMQAAFSTLRPHRNKHAHEYIKGATLRLDAPSISISRLHVIHAGLVDIEKVLKKIKSSPTP